MVEKINNVKHKEVSWDQELRKNLNELRKSIEQQNKKTSSEWNKEIENWNRTVTYNNWDVYNWQFVNGKKEWQWTYTWKNWDVYKWEWKNDKMEWQWTRSNANWDVYKWEWKNNKREWQWTKTNANWNLYKWEWKNNKREWRWTYTLKIWISYTWEWKNDMPKECKWTIVRKNWDRYDGDILIDKNGVPTPFHKIIYGEWRDEQIKSWNPKIRNMKWTYTKSNGSHHEFKYTNWSISEKSNDFITMYGDNKPDDNRSKERGAIDYRIYYNSANHIKYEISSWKRRINWEFDWKNYVFKDSKWKELKIPYSSKFDEKAAVHAANLINGIRYFNETKHWNWKYRYDEKNIYATGIEDHYNITSAWVDRSRTTEGNGTKLCKMYQNIFDELMHENLLLG